MREYWAKAKITKLEDLEKIADEMQGCYINNNLTPLELHSEDLNHLSNILLSEANRLGFLESGSNLPYIPLKDSDGLIYLMEAIIVDGDLVNHNLLEVLKDVTEPCVVIPDDYGYLPFYKGDYKVETLGRTFFMHQDEMANLFNNGQIEAAE